MILCLDFFLQNSLQYFQLAKHCNKQALRTNHYSESKCQTVTKCSIFRIECQFLGGYTKSVHFEWKCHSIKIVTADGLLGEHSVWVEISRGRFEGGWIVKAPESWRHNLKGIVQRDLTRAETRLKQSVLISYSVGKFSFWILKGHHHEISIKPFLAS
jgi:hypothetical protein